MPYYQVDPNFVLKNGRFPSPALRPRDFGYGEVIFKSVDHGPTIFYPQQPAKFRGDGEGTVLAGFDAVGEFPGLVVEGMSIGTLIVRRCVSPVLRNLTLGRRPNQLSPGLRVLDGSSGGAMDNCLVERVSVGNDGDCVGIQFGGGYNKTSGAYTPNANWRITNCRIGGRWTDGLQTTQSGWDKFSECPGLFVGNNYFWSDPTAHPGGVGPNHLEQVAGLDLKTAGKPGSPAIFSGNTFAGGCSSPINNPYGYQIAIHNMATDIEFHGNTFIFPDVHAALSIAPTRQEVKEALGISELDRRLRFRGNTWKCGNYWLWSRGTARFEEETVICQRLAMHPEAAGLPKREFVNCKIFEER